MIPLSIVIPQSCTESDKLLYFPEKLQGYFTDDSIYIVYKWICSLNAEQYHVFTHVFLTFYDDI